MGVDPEMAWGVDPNPTLLQAVMAAEKGA